MERELVLTGLLIITVGLTLLGAAPWAPTIAPKASARRWERSAWRALWWPSVPVVAVISILIGWAIMEPDPSDEPLPFSAFIVSACVLTLWLRAVIRATRALIPRTPLVAGTVGLWRPRAIFSDALVAKLDADALRAAQSHEAAHVRHRDPLRIWLAQLLTDLQWPWPAARRRFDAWRRVLELARDEEARASGADGADLAAAVLVAARLSGPSATGAALIDSSIGLEARVARLLGPVSGDQKSVRPVGTLALVPLSLLGLMSGVRFGEDLVQAIVKWL